MIRSTMMRVKVSSLLAAGIGLTTGLIGSASLAQSPPDGDPVEDTEPDSMDTEAPDAEGTDAEEAEAEGAEARGDRQDIYVAALNPLNEDIIGQGLNGLAAFVIQGDDMRIYVMAAGVPGGMAHLQHYHGFTDGTAAECPTPEADTNNDGVIDLIETQDTSGQTLVPLHDDPASLDGLLTLDRFPMATAPDGRVSYQQTVSMRSLETALQNQYGIDDLNLDNRVVFLHSISDGSVIPDSAQSVADVPARITLPIACGAIMRVNSN